MARVTGLALTAMPALAQAPVGDLVVDSDAPETADVTPGDGRRSRAPLPAVDEALTTPALGPPTAGPPPASPTLTPAPDTALTTPLEPLATFDATPPAPTPSGAATPVDEVEAGVRYTVSTPGLDPIGLGERFAELSTLRKGRGDRASGAQLEARIAADTDLLQRLVFSEGYYAARVEARTETGENGRAEVILTTTPGRRYNFSSIAIDRVPPDRPVLGTDFALKVGAPIVAATVEGAEAGLRLRLPQEGYPFARVGARDVLLDDDAATGDYSLRVVSGPRARFGRIRLLGDRLFTEDHAAVIARFEEGPRYDSRLIEDYRRALVATQLFGSVSVRPIDTGARDPDGFAVADIETRLTAGPLRSLGANAGYSTGEGVRVEGSWRHRNLFPPEGALTTRVVLGTQEQRLAVDVRKANFGQRDRSLFVGVDAANEDRPAYQARTLTALARLSRESTPIWQKRWTYSVGPELIYSDERGRADRERFDLGRRKFLIGALPGQVGYDRSNDLLDPTRGFRLLGRVTPELSREGGTIDTYVRVLGEASGYFPFGESFVLAGRTRIGTILGAPARDIAPSRRYYSGGGGSVRGFGYQDLGPRDANDDPLGGKSLNEFSLEGRYRFGDFGAVGFIDAGQVYSGPTPRFTDLRTGVGVGARYYTDFGPLRFDIATPLPRRSGDPIVAIYISIGQAF